MEGLKPPTASRLDYQVIFKRIRALLKIIYVIDYLYGTKGGTEKQLCMLIKGMVSRGHDVELFVFKETEFTNTVGEFLCPIHCLKVKKLASLDGLRSLWKFRQLIIAKKAEVMHGFFSDVAIVLPALTMLTGIKTYTSRRDMGVWYTPFRLNILRFFRFGKTRVLCNSHAVARIVKEKEWKPRRSIKVIYNGIERLSTCKTTHMVHWASNPSDVVKVILVANLRPVKRVEDLIRAAIRLRNGTTRMQYFVVGHLQDPVYCESLLSLVKEQQLENEFHFVGPLDEPRSGMAAFDIGVLTSASEGFSNTIMEYLDAGLPVVASRVGGNPELISEGYNGFLYDAGDDKALAVCVQKLAKDKALRRSLAENSRPSVKRFNEGKMVEFHAREYESRV